MSFPRTDPDGPELGADCGNCFGLCCVVLRFARSPRFAFTKDAAEPCRHLEETSRCGIHDRLRPSGMSGCSVYDCFGAGQHLSRNTFGGRDCHPAGTGGTTRAACRCSI